MRLTCRRQGSSPARLDRKAKLRDVTDSMPHQEDIHSLVDAFCKTEDRLMAVAGKVVDLELGEPEDRAGGIAHGDLQKQTQNA